jgi:hypothetical protein
MQINLGMVLKEVLDRLTLVSRKVVSDHMDLPRATGEAWLLPLLMTSRQ